ncbi:hypothetical protein SETIT_2G306000v2 [Setaria italica]|uniref:Uncharacterized protein n=2 Tax=Setaria TaxID=4554 RepID=A0A368Q4I3_SETIT|nr:hypothetical protein SETIT_2G306000v2 [Setaria italica]TKW34614.1 hypothetical protein SEVIR_2G317000v2 [Setaria viridis]
MYILRRYNYQNLLPIETAAHLCLHCCYAKEVWLLVSNWTSGIIKVPDRQGEEIEEWWRRSLERLSQNQKRSTAALLMYTLYSMNHLERKESKSVRGDEPSAFSGFQLDQRGSLSFSGHPFFSLNVSRV